MDELEATQAQETAPADGQPQESGLDTNAEGAIQAPEAGAQQELGDQATFLNGTPNLDPSKLPPDLQPIFKKMQGAYTRKMQDIARVREQAEVVERFYNDRNFAFQTLAQWAAQNGYQIAPVGQQIAQQQQMQAGQTSPIAEALKKNLPQELQWMAESQAPAIEAAVKNLLSPVVQQLAQHTQTTQQAARESEWDRHAAELSNVAPGWEEHEQEMSEWYDFLTSPAMNHPKLGSKLQVLYNLVTGNAATTAKVVKDMQRAAKNRPSSSSTTGRTASNIQDRVRGAKSSQDAFALAAQAAGFTGE